MNPIAKEFAFLSFCLSLGFLSNALTCYLSFGLQLEYFESCFASLSQNSCFDWTSFLAPKAVDRLGETNFLFKHASLSWKLLNMPCLVSFFRPWLGLEGLIWQVRVCFYLPLIFHLTQICFAFLSPACLGFGKAKLQRRGTLLCLFVCILNVFSFCILGCLTELRFETTDSELVSGFRI